MVSSTLWQPKLASGNLSVQVILVPEVHLGSSTSAVASFQYKCSTQSTLWHLQLGNRNCLSTSAVQEVHLGGSSSKAAIVQYKCNTPSTSKPSRPKVASVQHNFSGNLAPNVAGLHVVTQIVMWELSATCAKPAAISVASSVAELSWSLIPRQMSRLHISMQGPV